VPPAHRQEPPSHPPSNKIADIPNGISAILVEEGGFEPPKRNATDLQAFEKALFPLHRNGSKFCTHQNSLHDPNVFWKCFPEFTLTRRGFIVKLQSRKHSKKRAGVSPGPSFLPSLPPHLVQLHLHQRLVVMDHALPHAKVLEQCTSLCVRQSLNVVDHLHHQ